MENIVEWHGIVIFPFQGKGRGAAASLDFPEGKTEAQTVYLIIKSKIWSAYGMLK